MGDQVEVPFILYMDADEKTMTDRILERGKTSGRNDDSVEVLHKRFVTFSTETLPIIEKYEREGKVKKIDALRDIDEVYEDVKKAFEPYI